jgi:hypothetical protein
MMAGGSTNLLRLLGLHGRRSATAVLLLLAAVKAATASASAATTASTAAGHAVRAELLGLGLGLVVAAGEEAAPASTSTAATTAASTAVATTASTAAAAVHALGRWGHERDAGVATDEARLRLRWVAADEALLRLRWVADDLDGIAVAALVEVTTAATTEEGGGRERGEPTDPRTWRNATPAKRRVAYPRLPRPPRPRRSPKGRPPAPGCWLTCPVACWPRANQYKVQHTHRGSI